MDVKLVWAQDQNGAIGKKGKIPWSLPEDLKHFSDTTRGGVIIMGRKTWDSLPEKPLPGRVNFIVSKALEPVEGTRSFPDLKSALEDAERLTTVVWVVGGANIYKEALPLATEILITAVKTSIKGADAHAPEVPKAFEATSTTGPLKSKSGLEYEIVTYRRSKDA